MPSASVPVPESASALSSVVAAVSELVSSIGASSEVSPSLSAY